MSDLLITRVSPGVAVAGSTDPFSTLEIHRIDRIAWKSASTGPGVYILYGFIDGEPAACWSCPHLPDTLFAQDNAFRKVMRIG